MRVRWAWLLLAGGCGSPPEDDRSPAMKRLVDSLRPVTISVKNGESALVRLQRGLALVKPVMKDINDGTYTVWYSESGDFKRDSRVLMTGEAKLVSFELSLLGQKIDITGQTPDSAWVYLDLEDESMWGANIGTKRPDEVDLSKVRWRTQSPSDREALLQVLREQGIIR